MQTAVQIKSDKNNFAVNVQIKNVLKQDRNQVQHIDFRTQLHYLLVVIVAN